MDHLDIHIIDVLLQTQIKELVIHSVTYEPYYHPNYQKHEARSNHVSLSVYKIILKIHNDI